MKKKFFSICLILALVLSSVPQSVYAANGNDTTIEVTASSYTQDSLIANFDAIENTASGTHDSKTQKWVDTTGKYTAEIHNYYNGCWTEDSIILGNNLYLTFDAAFTEPVTIEIICGIDMSESASVSSLLAAADESTGIFKDGTSLYAKHHGGVQALSPTIKDYDGTPVVCTINGQTANLSYSDTTAFDVKYDSNVQNGSKLATGWIIGSAEANRQLKGEIYAIRIYGKQLSNEERAANTLADYVRFFSADSEYQSKIMLHEQTISDEDNTNQVVVTGKNYSSGYVFEDNTTYIFDHDVTISSNVNNNNSHYSGGVVRENSKVIFLLKNGANVTFHGADGQAHYGAGAGIYVPASSTLVITGLGTLNAYGGNAGEATDGGNGEDGAFSSSDGGLIYSGDGGKGGNGGGGAGAGIGGYGGDGGGGGNGGESVHKGDEGTLNGHWAQRCGKGFTSCFAWDGAAGRDGSDGAACGKICIVGSVKVNAYAGKANTVIKNYGARGAKADSRGFSYENEKGFRYEYIAGSSGGGAPGAGGQAPLYGIGGGGAGGPGGGGGSAGGISEVESMFSGNEDVDDWPAKLQKYKDKPYSLTYDEALNAYFNDLDPRGGNGGYPGKDGDSGHLSNHGRGGDGGHGGYFSGESGMSGSVYIDKRSSVTGRPCYYYDCTLYMYGSNVMATGLTPLTFGTSDEPTGLGVYTGSGEDRAALRMAIALKEAEDHNVLNSYVIASAPDSVKNKFTSSMCNGCYKVTSGSEMDNWYKEIVDTSDGYIYLLADTMMDYFKIIFDRAYTENSNYANPYDLVEVVFQNLKNKFGSSIRFTDSMRNLLHTIFYAEQYGEPEDGKRSGAGYTKTNQTTDTYAYHTSALKCLNNSFIIVCDSNTPRSVSAFYDTQRHEGEKGGIAWQNHYYYCFNSNLTVMHGKVGINPLNWMSYLSDNMQISEVNIPGTHDSATSTIIQPYVSALAICQDMNIKEQMISGIRMFDLRFKADGDSSNPFKNFVLCHGPANCHEEQKVSSDDLTLDTVFEQCRVFLKENPSEFLVFIYQQEGGNNDKFNKNEALMRADLAAASDIVLLKSGDVMPKVKDCRGKIVVLNSDDLCKYEDHYDVTAKDKIKYLKEIFTPTGLGQQDLNYSASRKVLNNKHSKIESEPKIVFTSSYNMEEYVSNCAKYVAPLMALCQNLLGFDYLDIAKLGKSKSADEFMKNGEAMWAVVATGLALMLTVGPKITSLSIIPGIIIIEAKGMELDGTPYTIAQDINKYFDTVTFKEGTRYGWLAMNFPKQNVIQRYYCSNAVDWDSMYAQMAALGKDRRIASVFSDGNPYILCGGAIIILAAAVASVLIIKKKKKNH